MFYDWSKGITGSKRGMRQLRSGIEVQVES